MNVPATPPPSTLATRWLAPLSIIGLGLALSGWIWLTLPPELRQHRPPIAGFLLLPAIALFGLAIVRRVGRQLGRSGDLVVTCLIGFLIALHTLNAAFGLGLIKQLDAAVPLATAVLFLGLGPTVGMLEPGSAIGIRIAATDRSEAIWRRAHHLLGTGFSLTGGIALALVFYRVPVAMATLVLGPGIALATAVLYARALERQARSASL